MLKDGLKPTVSYLKDLGDGLVLRIATAADTEGLAELNFNAHDDNPKRLPRVATWTRDLMSDRHPVVGPHDWVVVEDTNTGKIVSTTMLISQTWRYGGVSILVGRPELVATDPAYRRRGLVKAIFDVIHEMSAARGEIMQVITGIPWFYRQFGYDMALDLDGGRAIYEMHIPKLKDGESEPYPLRPATVADLPFMADLYDRKVRDASIFGVERSAAQWIYNMSGVSMESARYTLHYIIENRAGQPMGYARIGGTLWGPLVGLGELALVDGLGELEVAPSLMRQTLAIGKAEYAVREHPSEQSPYGIIFDFGREHPLYTAWGHELLRKYDPYAFYVRIPDLIGFLQHVQPALEANLADSPAAGYTGELRVNLYRRGVKFAFTQGKLQIEPWMPDQPGDGEAHFPDLTFFQMICGRRTAEELNAAFPDAWSNGVAKVLLNAMFPPFKGYLLAIA